MANKTLCLAIGIACLLLLAVRPAHALNWLPEFVSMTEEEQEEGFERPDEINPEYQSDVLTFTKPPRWQYEWLTRGKALDISVGSTGARDFLVANRLKIHQPLSEKFEFRFTYLEERDHERHSLHHILEVVFWPWKQLGISLYGEPHAEKRQDDTGIALILRPAPRHEIRLFNTFVDVARLRRSDRPDTFDEAHLPYVRGLVGRWWSDPEKGRSEFLEYAVRYETRTHWQFPEDELEYRFWRAYASLFGRKSLNDRLALSARFQFDRKLEQDLPLTLTSPVNEERWLNDRLFLTLRSEIDRIVPAWRWDLVAGIQYAGRKWDTHKGVARYHDYLPHIWLDVPAFGTGQNEDRFQIGYELTYHRESGSRAVLSPFRPYDHFDGDVEQRLNLVYEFVWGPRASLRLVATADIDRFGTRETWEGGNGQFRLSF